MREHVENVRREAHRANIRKSLPFPLKVTKEDDGGGTDDELLDGPHSREPAVAESHIDGLVFRPARPISLVHETHNPLHRPSHTKTNGCRPSWADGSGSL